MFCLRDIADEHGKYIFIPVEPKEKYKINKTYFLIITSD